MDEHPEPPESHSTRAARKREAPYRCVLPNHDGIIEQLKEQRFVKAPEQVLLRGQGTCLRHDPPLDRAVIVAAMSDEQNGMLLLRLLDEKSGSRRAFTGMNIAQFNCIPAGHR